MYSALLFYKKIGYILGRFRLCICYTKLLLDFGRSFAHTNLYFFIWDVQYIYLTAIIILLLEPPKLSPAEPKTYGSV